MRLNKKKLKIDCLGKNIILEDVQNERTLRILIIKYYTHKQTKQTSRIYYMYIYYSLKMNIFSSKC